MTYLRSKKTVWLHPLLLMSLVWGGVALLYSLRLSKMLIYSNSDLLYAIALILGPMIAVASANRAFRSVAPIRMQAYALDRTRLDWNLGVCTRFWIAAAIVETIVSGGLPAVWLLTGSAKNYDSYGIPSIHGLVNSLFLALAACRYTEWAATGEKRHLRFPLFALAWCLLLVNRSMFVVSLLQYGVVYLRLRPVMVKTVMRSIAGAILFVLGFGIIGDVRQGSDSLFRVLAQPTEAYPEWLPSGVLWVYIYITTPVNNLIHTMKQVRPDYSFMFANSLAGLFPSLVRKLVYGARVDDALSGRLVSEAFNASTAFVGAYQDFGAAGVMLVSTIFIVGCQTYWQKSTSKDTAIFAVLTQCLVFTLFDNNLFSLPVVFQLIWFQIFFAGTQRAPSRTMPSRLALDGTVNG